MNEFSMRRRFGPTPKYDMVLNYKRPKNDFVKILGPCSVESEIHIHDMASLVTIAGATHLRGGVFRAGTYPGNRFGWIDEHIIKSYHTAAQVNGLENIIEVLDYRDIDRIGQYCTAFQVGARQQQNYQLLNALGSSGKPVFLKRNMGSTIDEWLGSAEYVLKAGCNELYLIERGSSTYHQDVRWVPTVHMIPSIKSICDIPVIWDASHSCGRRDIVPSVCLAGVAAGADGVLIECHTDPEKSLSDADQAIRIDQLRPLMDKINIIRGVIC